MKLNTAEQNKKEALDGIRGMPKYYCYICGQELTSGTGFGGTFYGCDNVKCERFALMAAEFIKFPDKKEERETGLNYKLLKS